jgi:hypothetical protein
MQEYHLTPLLLLLPGPEQTSTPLVRVQRLYTGRLVRWTAQPATTRAVPTYTVMAGYCGQSSAQAPALLC